MGFKGLNTYVTKNIQPSCYFWKLNKTLYRVLSSEDIHETKLLESKSNKNGSVNLIIDGYSYLFSIANKLNWFVYDNYNLLKWCKKVFLN